MNDLPEGPDQVVRSLGDRAARQIVYTFDRAGWLEGWWAWALAVVAISLLLWGVVRLYYRDTLELPQPVRYCLITLRLTTILALVFFFFSLERRSQQVISRPSEVALLVDTSQSMSLPAENRVGAPSRSEVATEIVAETGLLDTLAQQHRVTVYAFDDDAEPRELEVRTATPDDAAAVSAAPVTPATARPVSPLAVAGALALLTAAVLALVALVLGIVGRGQSAAQPLLWAALLMVIGGIALASAWTARTDQSLVSLLGLGQTASPPPAADPEDAPQQTPPPPSVNDWDEALLAAGSQSRIGDAIRDLLTRHDPTTLAGIVLLSDGQNNGGTPAASAASLAARGAVAIYPIGLGSAEAPVNVRIVDLEVPQRVYPGDRFVVAATLQASGPSTMSVQVQLLDGPDGQQTPAQIVDSREVQLKTDGTLTGVRFELEPDDVGRRRLAIRVVPPPGDQNDEDDIREARYEVVARKLRVLAIAGGPMREYRFVRNLLFRDPSTEIDVLLQTGQPGMSQDADRQLSEFPQTPEQLFQYDAIIAFDPDWMALDAAQLDLIDRWLAEQAGGLILVAGPVYQPEWSRLRTDPRVSKLAGFFPVNLSGRSPLLSGGRQGGETPWPLQFTPEALRSEFLWVTDQADTSFEAWEESGGVYDYLGVKDAKPGAKVYAYFSDPTSAVGDVLPVYLASQFYGAGRVFFQGSGEMWRLRGVSDAYFDNYYTKLIRWVSEGRLLRDSNCGILLVDRPRAMVGETITVRAVLTDEQFEALQVPVVEANLLAPGGRIETVRLTPVEGESRPGTYSGRFLVREAGSHQLRLTLGDALREQVLRQAIQVRLPTLELERPRRNDEDLQLLAAVTGGRYVPVDQPAAVGIGGSTSGSALGSLPQVIRPQPQTTILPGTPDRDFARRRNASLMWLIASCLTMEWIVRRSHRLA